MRNKLCSLVYTFLFVSTCYSAQSIFLGKKSYELVGSFEKVADINKIKTKKLKFFVNKGASSQITVYMENLSLDKIRRLNNKKARVCFLMKENCDFQCHGKITQVKKILSPWHEESKSQDIFKLATLCQ